MKHIDDIYKEWCGKTHVENSCHPVHDSAEAMDFAEFYHKEIVSNSGGTVCYTSEAVQVCGSWVKCDIELPPDADDYMFLADFDGELLECFGYYDRQNRVWVDKSNVDSDSEPTDVYTAKYWLKLDSKPEV